MRPYLTFAAKEDISAGTELTIDYSPEPPDLSRDGDVNMDDGSALLPSPLSQNRTRIRCLCGAENCRGELTLEH